MSEQPKYQGTWFLPKLNSTVIFVTDRKMTQAELDAVIAAYKLAGCVRRIKPNQTVTIYVEEWQIEAAVMSSGR